MSGLPSYGVTVCGVRFGDVFRRDDGALLRVVGLIDQPAVVLEDVATSDRRTVVIDSPFFDSLEHLVPRVDVRATPEPGPPPRPDRPLPPDYENRGL